MIALVEGAIRQKTPNEIALTIVLAAFSMIFLIVTATLYPMWLYFDPAHRLTSQCRSGVLFGNEV